VWASLMKIPAPHLYAGIAVFCGLGVYATSSSVFDLALLLVIAVLGLVLRRYGVPLAPLMIGMVLGPLAETNFRDALLSSGGSYATFFSSPLSIILYIVLAAALVYTAFGRLRGRRVGDIGGASASGDAEAEHAEDQKLS